MTWLSHICFSLICATALPAAVITGNVTLQPSKGARNLAGVVIWLEPSNDSGSAAHPRSVRMLQKGKTFIPHVLAIPVNSSVEFPNLDPIFHNAFSNFDGQVFDVGLYPPGTSRSVKFRREGVVRIFCNIHPTMSAVIVVLKSPWFDATGADGGFEISGVPPGEYRLKIFHERATAATLERLERRLIVSADLALPPIVISEAGYITMPHKNKYGKDYPAVTHDVLPYPGGPK